MALAHARQQRRIEMGQHGVSDGCRQRVAAEGGAMGAAGRPAPFLASIAPIEAAPSFGAGEDVRDDVVMLVGVEMAGTPGAGLHLIEYQGGMMAIAEGTQRLQERRVRDSRLRR